jgi:predicted NBD/HSP70 family sugar kinase
VGGTKIEAIAIAEAAAAGVGRPTSASNSTMTGWPGVWLRLSMCSILTRLCLGGGLSNLTRLYPALPALLNFYTFSADTGTPIVRAMHGDFSGVRGAAWLWPISGIPTTLIP